MTQPNEQLIETIAVTVSRLPESAIENLENRLDELSHEYDMESSVGLEYKDMRTFQALVIGYHAAWDEIERLLEENKRMKDLLRDEQQDLASLHSKFMEISTQLQHTREELEGERESHQSDIEEAQLQSLAEIGRLSRELQQVKAERDAYRQEILFGSRTSAHTILSQYKGDGKR